VLALRHENTVLRRHVQKVRYRPEDRLWFAALSGLIPRRRWAEVFPVTPGTMPARPSSAPVHRSVSTRARPDGLSFTATAFMAETEARRWRLSR
jgi:hypothetical protein